MQRTESFHTIPQRAVVSPPSAVRHLAGAGFANINLFEELSTKVINCLKNRITDHIRLLVRTTIPPYTAREVEGWTDGAAAGVVTLLGLHIYHSLQLVDSAVAPLALSFPSTFAAFTT